MVGLSDHFLARSCGIASVSVATTLVLIKSYMLYTTSSFSVQASLLDSVLDICAAGMNFFAIRKALQPPTKNYRFGFGKAEALAGLFQSMMISFSAIFLIIKNTLSVFGPSHIMVINSSIFLLLFLSSSLTISLVLWQKYVLKRVKSLAIQADSLHYETDLYMDLGVFLNFLVIHFWSVTKFDYIFGTLALFFILHKTYPILKQSFDVLMDRELDEELRLKIVQTVYKNEHVKNIHQLRTRLSGQYEVIQFHIVLSPEIKLSKAHDIAHSVEKEILAFLPKAHIIIHQDCEQDQEDVAEKKLLCGEKNEKIMD